MNEGKEVFVVVRSRNDVMAGLVIDRIELFENQDDAYVREGEFRSDGHKIRGKFEVALQKVKIQSPSIPQKSLSDLQTISQKMQKKEKSAKTTVQDDPMNPNWPFGFDCFGKAITMRQMLEDPDSALDPSFLEPSDQWKVVKARIKRYKDDWIDFLATGLILKSVAMEEVSERSSTGEMIRDEMISWLQDQMNEAWEKKMKPPTLDLSPEQCLALEEYWQENGSSETHDDFFDD